MKNKKISDDKNSYEYKNEIEKLNKEIKYIQQVLIIGLKKILLLKFYLEENGNKFQENFFFLLMQIMPLEPQEEKKNIN